MDNVISENLDQHWNDGGTQQLYVLIRELKYRDTMDIKKLLNYLRENEAISKLLRD